MEQFKDAWTATSELKIPSLAVWQGDPLKVY